jgi:hypothetical protein
MEMKSVLVRIIYCRGMTVNAPSVNQEVYTEKYKKWIIRQQPNLTCDEKNRGMKFLWE